jgi:hypothetical protein
MGRRGRGECLRRGGCDGGGWVEFGGVYCNLHSAFTIRKFTCCMLLCCSARKYPSLHNSASTTLQQICGSSTKLDVVAAFYKIQIKEGQE